FEGDESAEQPASHFPLVVLRRCPWNQITARFDRPEEGQEIGFDGADQIRFSGKEANEIFDRRGLLRRPHWSGAVSARGGYRKYDRLIRLWSKAGVIAARRFHRGSSRYSCRRRSRCPAPSHRLRQSN